MPIVVEQTIKLNIRKDRLEKIIKEVAEQSGRGIVPILQDPIDFEEAAKSAKRNNINFIFDSSGVIFRNSRLEIRDYAVGVWVGPEGGWTPSELEKARSSGFEIVSLGRLIFRAETAAMIASYLSLTF